MKNRFKEYQPLTEEDVHGLWERATIVPDTNILLNLYRYSVGTRDELLSLFEDYKNRLWIPYQVGLEYLSNRENVVNGVGNVAGQLKKAILSAKSQIDKVFNEKATSRHPTINREDVEKAFKETVEQFNSRIDELAAGAPDYQGSDVVYAKLLELFDGKVGEDFSAEELTTLYQEGALRYADQIPPGYKDEKDKKHEGMRHLYGDLIIWKQLMRYAKETNSDVIFVTDDKKEDWWSTNNGQHKAPRVELLREFYRETGQQLLMYQQSGFLNASNKTIKNETKDEVTAVEREDDKSSTVHEVLEGWREWAAMHRDAMPAVPAFQNNDLLRYLTADPARTYFDEQKRIKALTQLPVMTSMDAYFARPAVPRPEENAAMAAIAGYQSVLKDILDAGK